jgi:hypothetical protein
VTETSTYSTLFLTLLMMIGLFFFIRASTKDRTETLILLQPTSPEAMMQDLIRHFQARAYTLQTIDAEDQQVSLRGMVRPSLFLAIFLTILAAIGLLCLALVLASLFSGWGVALLGLTLLAPAAGLYYWQRAGREEQITLQVTSTGDRTSAEQSRVTITAHRDELIALQQTLKMR